MLTVKKHAKRKEYSVFKHDNYLGIVRPLTKSEAKSKNLKSFPIWEATLEKGSPFSHPINYGKSMKEACSIFIDGVVTNYENEDAPNNTYTIVRDDDLYWDGGKWDVAPMIFDSIEEASRELEIIRESDQESEINIEPYVIYFFE